MPSSFWQRGFGRSLGRVLDWGIPGNAFNSGLNRWNPATLKTGITGLVASQFVPGGEHLISGLARSGAFGSGLANRLVYERNSDAMTPSYLQTRQGAADYLGQNTLGQQDYSAPANSRFVGQIGMNPQLNGGIAGMLQAGRPQGGFTGFQPTFATRDWQGGAFNQNVQTAQNTMASREAAAMQAIQSRINGVPVGGHVGGRGSGQISGGAKSNFGFEGWDSEEAREASIAAVGDALRESRNATPNNRQTGTDLWGNRYQN